MYEIINNKKMKKAFSLHNDGVLFFIPHYQ